MPNQNEIIVMEKFVHEVYTEYAYNGEDMEVAIETVTERWRGGWSINEIKKEACNENTG